MLTNIARILIPESLRKKIRHHYFAQFELELTQSRVTSSQHYPKIALQSRDMARCKVIPSRHELLESIPKNGILCEIGVDSGDFSAEILDVCKPRELHLVDAWGTERFHDGLLKKVQHRFEKEISDGIVKIHRALSLNAVSEFVNEYFDFIYIDSVHDYETTLAELFAYAPKVRNDGFLAGHDYLVGNWNSGMRYGVIEAVHEFVHGNDWELAAITVNYSEFPSFALRKRGDVDTPAESSPTNPHTAPSSSCIAPRYPFAQ
jgi:hypothetical protein